MFQLSDAELALIIEALEDNAGVFDEGAKDEACTSEEKEMFATDAKRCRELAIRLNSEQ